MKIAGLFTINGWAIDGFTKVFWYDEPVSHLWQQVGILLAIGALGRFLCGASFRAPLGIRIVLFDEVAQ